MADDLFTTTELATFLQVDEDDNAAVLALTRTMAVDLLLDAMQRSAVPDPPPPGLKSLAIGVAARLVTNPTGEQSEPTAGGAVVHGIVQTPSTGAVLAPVELAAARRFRVQMYEIRVGS